MATVNPSLLRSRTVAVSAASSIDDIEEVRGTFAIVGGDLYLYGDDGLRKFSAGLAITRPAFESGVLASDGLALSIEFTEEVAAVDFAVGFAVFADGEPVAIASAALSESELVVNITLSEAVLADQAVLVRYRDGGIANASGMSVRDFSALITNDSEVTE